MITSNPPSSYLLRPSTFQDAFLSYSKIAIDNYLTNNNGVLCCEDNAC